MVEDSQRLPCAQRPRHWRARRAEDTLVGGVHHDARLPHAHVARFQTLARLLGHDDQMRTRRRADALLHAHRARDRAVQRSGELRLIELRKGVVHVEHHRRTAKARQQGRRHHHVGHVVRLHHVEAPPQVERRQPRQRARREVRVLAHVGARAAHRLAPVAPDGCGSSRCPRACSRARPGRSGAPHRRAPPAPAPGAARASQARSARGESSPRAAAVGSSRQRLRQRPSGASIRPRSSRRVKLRYAASGTRSVPLTAARA